MFMISFVFAFYIYDPGKHQSSKKVIKFQNIHLILYHPPLILMILRPHIAEIPNFIRMFAT